MAKFTTCKPQGFGLWLYPQPLPELAQVLLIKKIEEQNNKLQNIIEGTRLGTWEWEIQTGKMVINERFTEIFGYMVEELMPVSVKTWIKYTHLDDLKKSYDSLKRHFSKKSEYYTAEFRMKHKNGDWVWILSKGKVIEWSIEEKPVKMFGTHSDITEKKQLEEKPHLKGKDLESTKKACEKFKHTPVSIINFVEGTRFTPQKKSRQKNGGFFSVIYSVFPLVKPVSTGI